MKKCKIRIEETLCMTIKLIANNGEAVCHIIKQQYQKQEFIITGDHFTDGSFGISEELEDEQNKIRRKYATGKVACTTKKRHRRFRCLSCLRNQ